MVIDTFYGNYRKGFKSPPFHRFRFKQKIGQRDGKNAIVIMPRYNRCALYDNAFEPIANLSERMCLLRPFLFTLHLKGGLYIIAPAAAVHHKIHLILPAYQFPVLVPLRHRHDTHIHRHAAGKQFVVNHVLHQMPLVLLTEKQPGVAQPQIREIVLLLCADILPSFDVVPLRLGKQKRVFQILFALFQTRCD